MRFVNASIPTQVAATQPSTAYVNYFIGSDSSKWASYVHAYAEVCYKGSWPGIDLRLHGADDNFKYDILSETASSIANVGFAYEGLTSIAIDGEGRLILETSVGKVVELKPVAWYADGGQEPLQCQFSLSGNIVGFRLVGPVDNARPIVIDPVVMASTLSGTGNLGMTANFGHCATFDDMGNIYTGGHCFGQGYPVTLGAFQTGYGGGGGDIAVSKLNPDGSALIWATYFGGSDTDLPSSMVVDVMGNLSVMGTTSSSDYPCSATGFDNTFGGGPWPLDLVVSKVDVSGGVLIGSTFMGGSGADGLIANGGGIANRGEIGTDAAGNIYVISCTQSPNFPISPGALQPVMSGISDAIAFRLSPDLSALDWSTFIGGSGIEEGLGMELEANGDVCLCGYTGSSDFPTTAGGYQTSFQGGSSDGFILKLVNGGSLLGHSSFFGSPDDDEVSYVDRDVAGDVHLYGSMGSNIPIVPVGGYATGGTMYVAQFDPTLTGLITSSSIGAPTGFTGPTFRPTAFLVDNCDRIYISACGSQVPANQLPITPDFLQFSGGFYLAEFDADMASLLFATYYGGGSDHVDGGMSRFDKNGKIYQAVCTIGGFPTLPNAFSSVQPVGYDIGVFKIDFEPGVIASGSYVLQGCAPAIVDFTNNSVGTNWLWDYGDGSQPDTTFEPSHQYASGGSYWVTLIAFNSLSCNLSDTITFQVTIPIPQTIDAAFLIDQIGDCTLLSVQGTNQSTGDSLSFLWNMGDGTTYTSADVTHAYAQPGTYVVELLIDDLICGGLDSSSATITVINSLPVLAASSGVICPGLSTTIQAIGVQGVTYLWNTGQIADNLAVSSAGTYWVVVSDGFCTGSDTVEVIGAPAFELGYDMDACPGSLINLSIPFDGTTYLWEMGAVEQSVTFLFPGADTTDYAFQVWDTLGCVHKDSVTVRPLDSEPQLFVPNAFTPNGDNINDIFVITGYGENEIELMIFDRWGEQVFTTTRLTPAWDGMYNGEIKQDVYVYRLRYNGECSNDQKSVVGHVTLVR